MQVLILVFKNLKNIFIQAMHLGKNIKYLRESRGLSQTDIATVVGMKSYTTIGKWEEDLSKPSFPSLFILADYFDVPLKDLIFDDLSSGVKTKQVDQDEFEMMARNLSRLDKILLEKEQLEKEIRETPGAIEALKNVAPELAKKIEQK